MLTSPRPEQLLLVVLNQAPVLTDIDDEACLHCVSCATTRNINMPQRDCLSRLPVEGGSTTASAFPHNSMWIKSFYDTANRGLHCLPMVYSTLAAISTPKSKYMPGFLAHNLITSLLSTNVANHVCVSHLQPGVSYSSAWARNEHCWPQYHLPPSHGMDISRY